MHQCPGDLDHGNAIDQHERLVLLITVTFREVSADQRGPGRQSGMHDISLSQIRAMKGDFLPGNPGSQPGQKCQRLGWLHHQGCVERALGDPGVMHHFSGSLSDRRSDVS